ncbi:uncharacterized protein [Ptychodera flava]|uniref:uncharacterized protein n=1 Tax=Ptychodera flava TaxID=63121 RepID=UPI00396A0AF0
MVSRRNNHRIVALLVLALTSCIARGSIEVNVDKGEEIYKTVFAVSNDGSEVRAGPDAPYTVRDVNKKLDALVDEANGVCYLSGYDANTEVSPVDLKAIMEAGEEETDEQLEDMEINNETDQISGRPLEDVTAMSVVIGPHCKDKTTYWTVPVDEVNEENSRAARSRNVKQCRIISTITGYKYVRRCFLIIFFWEEREGYTRHITRC